MQPLRDLKVLDFSMLLPGPFASMYLADWGADVLRIESPDREDLSRTTPPFADGVSTTHGFLNRSKKSLVIDLKDKVGVERIKDLVKSYDIVIEQFRPGVMDKLGIGYAELSRVNKRLIFCSLTGYGQTGPYRDRAGHDINYAALSGMAIMTGSHAGGPVLHGTPVCDLAGSFHALTGILMALYHREKTGEGQYIDVSITDSSLMLSGLWAQMAVAAGEAPRWESTLLNGGSFYGYYRTKDQAYLSVGGLEPKFLRGFLEAIDGLGLMSLAVQDPLALKRAIGEKIGSKDLTEWLMIFDKIDVCVEPLLGFDQMKDHPHFVARQMFIQVPLGEAKGSKAQTQVASPLKFSTFKPIYRFVGTTKGAHNT